MYYTYALKSIQRNYIYVGLTNNVHRRLKEHNNGYNKTTRSYRPFRVILQEEYATRKQARTKEKYLKSGAGKDYLKTL